ncbi:RES family NAD+ phosphorylase [Budvicia diplopodorum]|uniref:RES family NAD+ phosphorylase n=1 Tax=Budvicia diplopodorum TaxID=1119056 RepID=UPI00135BBA7A|nr:RES domain-containing protein [Budvicia diplopodorum]
MKLYRIVKTKHLGSAWSGFGAEQYGGRWNHPGYAAIYAATSISLAMLEMLVHLQKSQLLENYVTLAIEIPDLQITTLEISSLSNGWNSYPAPDETMDIGDSWLESYSSACLLVPSVIVPTEYNALLNPRHHELITCIQSVEIKPLSFDQRFLSD